MSKVDVEPTVQWVGKDEIRVDSKNDNLSNKVQKNDCRQKFG